MTGLLSALRGLAHRAGISLSILLVALVAVAAVTIGPAYYTAAQSSILQDTVNQAQVTGRGLEVNQSGPAAAISMVTAVVQPALAGHLGGAAVLHRIFARPITAAETTVQAHGQTVPLVHRSGMCAHLRFAAGHCPSGADQVVVSRSLAFLFHWHLGQRIAVPTWKHLTITGVYRITAAEGGASYWFDAASRYFPYENQAGSSPAANPYDAMFTPLATLNAVPGTVQGTDYVDFALIPGHLTGADLPVVASAMQQMVLDPSLEQQGATTTTSIPATLGAVRASWRAVEVPVVLISAQLLILAWLLLFLLVADAAEARGPEVALAKMRGRGRWRTLTFGLAEPVILLAIALPAGAAAGWAITTGLAHVLLRPGTPVGLPATAWLAAAVATAGGLIAVVVAARRTLGRPVVDQWQRASRAAAQRGWVVDSILLTAAVAGLIELRVSGQIGSARRGVLGLLLPGLLGVAVAVAASRLLIVACRAGFGPTQRRGRIAPFLALRHIARRPGGMRATIVLATAFALASFAVAIWSVTVGNIRAVAGARAGAATVLTVIPPAGHSLGSIVDRIDPGGREATAVYSYTNPSGASAGQVMLAVDPQRFARIAAWQPGWLGRQPAALAAALDPPAPRPVVLTGSQVRIRFQASGVRPAGSTLVLALYEEGVGAIGQTPVYFGNASGSRTVVQPLTGSPCLLGNLTISAPPPSTNAAVYQPGQVTGQLTIASIEVRSGHGRWVPVDAGLGDPGRWRTGGSGGSTAGSLRPGPGGLRWSFKSQPGQDAVAVSVNRPYPVPALIARGLTPSAGAPVTVAGLDGSPLQVNPVAVPAAIPGAPGNGVVVDRTYAERAAGGTPGYASQQVWLAPGALGRVRPALVAAGVRITGVTSAATLQARLVRQGPALATVLFLTDALAAAVLAAGAVVASLYASGRRRRYEYAALIASRISRGSVRASLLTEQAIVLGFGAVIGVASGLLATLLAVHNVPEFVSQPSAPPLSYAPSATGLAVLLGGALVAGAAAAIIASLLLVRSVQPDLLREAEP
jgi:putative ABC transport system permease protein